MKRRLGAWALAAWLALPLAANGEDITSTGGNGGGGGVTSVAPNADGCLSATPNPITATGTIDVAGGALPASCVAHTPLNAGSSTGNTLTGPREYFVCTSTCTVTPPVPVAGYEFCIENGVGVSTVITMGRRTNIYTVRPIERLWLLRRHAHIGRRACG